MAAVALLIVGLIATSVMPQDSKGRADFSGLREAEQGPLKV